MFKPPAITPRAPTVQRGRDPTVVELKSQSVTLAVRGTSEKRTAPTELFVTCFSLQRLRQRDYIPTPTVNILEPTAPTDHAKLVFNAEQSLGILCGFWWASSAMQADTYWSQEFRPPESYTIVGRDTIMVPRSLLKAASIGRQTVGRSKVWLGLYVLGGMTFDQQGRLHTKASYIRATSPEMAIRVWQSASNGLMSTQRHAPLTALPVPSYWLQGVLKSPEILIKLREQRNDAGRISHQVS